MKYFKSTISWLFVWTILWVVLGVTVGSYLYMESHNPFAPAFMPFLLPVALLTPGEFVGRFEETILPALIYWSVFGCIIIYKKNIEYNNPAN